MRIEFDATADDLIGLWGRLFRRSKPMRRGLRRKWLMHAGFAVLVGVMVFALLDGVDPPWRFAQSGAVVAVGLAIHAISFSRWLHAHLRHAAAVRLAGRTSFPVTVELAPQGIWCAEHDIGFGLHWRDVIIVTSARHIDFMCNNEEGQVGIGVPDRVFSNSAARDRFLNQAIVWQDQAATRDARAVRG